MKRIIENFKQINIPLKSFIGLEFFAREGSWQTLSYGNYLKELYLWEKDQKFEKNLRSNFPKGKITIGNSYEIAKNLSFRNKFDFIVYDNPQGIYDNYCEHFDALPLTPFLCKEKSIIIFNVNKNPFDYDDYPNSKIRRKSYYGKNAGNLSSEFILNFYKSLFNSLGFTVQDCFEEERNDQYLSYLIFFLKKDILLNK